jgi:gliding motility-associated lipoprotein GldH
MYYKLLGILFGVLLCMQACVPNNRVERTFYTPTNGWRNSEIKTFEFYISDTTVQYNWLLLMQHTYNYDFSNIWLNITTTFPNGKYASVKQEIPLAFSDGRWMGRSVNGITTQELNLGPNSSALKFSQIGKHTITFQHIMRQDPLMDVQYIGMAIEKVLK